MPFNWLIDVCIQQKAANDMVALSSQKWKGAKLYDTWELRI